MKKARYMVTETVTAKIVHSADGKSKTTTTSSSYLYIGCSILRALYALYVASKRDNRRVTLVRRGDEDND